MLSDLEMAYAKARSSGVPTVSPYSIAAESAASPFSMAKQQSGAWHAREQYQHRDGRVFSALRVIEQRVAAQPVVVARIGRPAQKRLSLRYALKEGLLSVKTLPDYMKRYCRRSGKGYLADEVEVLHSHGLLDAIENPNELMVTSHLWAHTVANLGITGRSIWLLIEENGRKQIIPIPTTWATPQHAKGDNGQFYTSWDIKPPGTSEKPISIPGQFVANFYFADPENPFGCTSPLQMQARAVLSDRSISIAQNMSFENSMTPSVALTVGEAVTGDGKRQYRLEPEQRRQLTTWIKQEYAGVKKFGNPLILDNLISDLKVLQNKPMEMAYGDSAELTKGYIYEGFGVNPISAGQVEGSNRASSGIADHHLVTNCVNPVIYMLSQVMNKSVVPFFIVGRGEKVRAWIVPCDSYDPGLEMQKWNLGRQMFCVTRNDARTKLLGLSAVPGWDDVIIPTTMRSVMKGDPVLAIGGNGTGKDTPQDSGRPPAGQDLPKKGAILFRGNTVHPQWKKDFDNAEKQASEAFSKLIGSQVEDAAAKLESFEAVPLTNEYFKTEDWYDKVKDAAGGLLKKQMIRGATVELHLHQKSIFELPDPVIEKIDLFYSDVLKQPYWSDISETTRTDIVDIVQRGVLEGDSPTDIAKKLRTALGRDYRTGRARNIAMTEMSGGLNAGQFAAQATLIEEGVGVGRQWLGIDDDVERDTHRALNETVVTRMDDFLVGGFPARFPGDWRLPAKERCQCRCTVVLVTEFSEFS